VLQEPPEIMRHQTVAVKRPAFYRERKEQEIDNLIAVS
jgi:hypothetical protein